MKPTSKQLALRDGALAAVLGIIPGNEGNFGDESDFGADFGADFGDEMMGEFGADFGDDYGADAPAAHPAAAAGPSRSQLMALWKHHAMRQSHTARREMLLEPNKYSTTKIERYSFTLNQALVIGTALAFTTSGNPDYQLRAQRVTMNVPTVGFCTISEIKVANVSVTSGGADDAFNYNSNGVGQSLDMPTLSPQNKASVIGNYTGLAPAPFAAPNPFLLTITFKGPSNMVA